MNIPRSNNFRIILPENIIPVWVNRLYIDVLRDAGLLKVYDGNPVNCIMESVIGFDTPGKHMVLSEQKVQDSKKTGYKNRFYPKGLNAMRVIADDEFSLELRHVDGYHNYHMIEQAIIYMSNDDAQNSQNETYKSLGNVSFIENLTSNWKIVNTYGGVVYSQIDGNTFKYADGASEKTFNVRFKFSTFSSAYFYRDKLITEMNYNHAVGN